MCSRFTLTAVRATLAEMFRLAEPPTWGPSRSPLGSRLLHPAHGGPSRARGLVYARLWHALTDPTGPRSLSVRAAPSSMRVEGWKGWVPLPPFHVMPLDTSIGVGDALSLCRGSGMQVGPPHSPSPTSGTNAAAPANPDAFWVDS